MATYIVITPDNQVVSRNSNKPLTYGIAHLSGTQGQQHWIVNSFSYGKLETAEKRMRSLQKFYGGQWQVVEARLQKDD